MKSSSVPPTDQQFSDGDVDRILAETFVDRVEYRTEIASTNSRALQLTSEETCDSSSTLVLTDRQTEGRGRGMNRWWSADGALTFSVLLKPDAVQLPTSLWPLTSLTTGLAVCEAIEDLLDDVTLALKWPNDVFLAGRKLCGILVEATDGRQRSLVIGIGVNVNNSVQSAPAEVRDNAVALCDVATRPVRRIEVLIAILQRLAARLERLTSGEQELGEHWRRRCLLTGRSVHLELPLRRIVGVCRGIDDDGALILETESGIERCISGVIQQFN